MSFVLVRLRRVGILQFLTKRNAIGTIQLSHHQPVLHVDSKSRPELNGIMLCFGSIPHQNLNSFHHHHQFIRHSQILNISSSSSSSSSSPKSKGNKTERERGMKYICKYCNKSSHQMVMDYDHVLPDGCNYNTYHDGDDDDGDELGGYGDALDHYSLSNKVKGSGSTLDSSLTVNSHRHHVCKECGKGFRSLKALCGHMACHSYKERPSSTRHRHEYQVGDKQQRLFVDATADSSEPCRRSKRVRFMNHTRAATKFVDGFSFISGMTTVEEVARCLMMMSNDRRVAGCWGRVGDCSGSPSVELEDKMPSSGGYSGSPKYSSDEISYEPKQGYKKLDTLKGCYTKIKRDNAKKRENNNNRHECPICLRVFKSGQAMGGHKRSHFLQGGVEEAASVEVVTEKEVPMIDLNFPAFVEEGDDGLFPW